MKENLFGSTVVPVTQSLQSDQTNRSGTLLYTHTHTHTYTHIHTHTHTYTHIHTLSHKNSRKEEREGKTDRKTNIPMCWEKRPRLPQRVNTCSVVSAGGEEGEV